MARRKTSGLTTETVNRFVVNAGAVYINLGLPDEKLIGATRDGVTFTIEQDIAEIEVDGSPGPFMGGRRILEVRPRIETTLLEMTAENFKLAIAGADSADFTDEGATAPTHNAITRNRGIAVSDYIANVAVVGTLSGSNENFIGIIYNALQDGEISLESADSGEAGLGVTFTGHFDPSNMEQEPWEIRIPKEADAVTAPLG
jgi:hypothetical protein